MFAEEEQLLGRVISDLRSWETALNTIAVDLNRYPETQDIRTLAEFVQSPLRKYWVEPVVADPWGNPYRYESDTRTFRVWSMGPDREGGTGDDVSVQGEEILVSVQSTVPEKITPTQAPRPRIPATPPQPLSPDSDLRVYKCTDVTNPCGCTGNSVCLFWTGALSPYDGTRDEYPEFFTPSLLFAARPAPPYFFVYTNGLANGLNKEFFDITDQTGNETNQGADASGVLPPPAPQIGSITGSPSLFIGGTGTITGSNFSDVRKDNLICLLNGPCVFPDTATTTDLTFTVPAGALTGEMSLSAGELQSDVVSADVGLEDPALPALIPRTLGYAVRTDGGTLLEPTGDYYTGASEAGVNKILQHSFNTATKKWDRTNRAVGPDATDTHYCSTRTDRNKYLYCADATQATGIAKTRRILTDPASNMAGCISFTSTNLPAGHCGAADNCRVIGAAPDPNPNNVPGRDVIYFLFENVSVANRRYIKKVSADCATILDQDYGNRGGVWNWTGANVFGSSVDADTGDLYLSERTIVIKITTAEAVSTFKSGFTNLNAVDIWHEPGTTFGLSLLVETGTSSLKMLALDNAAASPVTLAGGLSVPRGGCFAAGSLAESEVDAGDKVLHISNNHGGAIQRRSEPFLIADAYSPKPHQLWISSPDTKDQPPFQGTVRSSKNPAPTDYSTFKVQTWWRDGLTRPVCAALGDEPTFAPYEPRPTPQSQGGPKGCTKPWRDIVNPAIINGVCDNNDPFDETAGGTGVGTTTASGGGLVDCQDCGGSNDPCIFEFRITQRHGGNNYRYHFQLDNNPWTIKSAHAGAWKRIFAEQEGMCITGGMLWEDPGREPDVQVGDGAILIAKENTVRVDNLQLNQTIDIFDVDNPFDKTHDQACIGGIDDTTSPDYVIVTLGAGGSPCSGTYALAHNYDASVPNPAQSPPNWDFSIGKSAGVCVDALGYYLPNTTNINRGGVSDPFNDGFLSLPIRKDGSSVVPRLSPDFFNNQGPTDWARFHQSWFKNNNAQSSPNDYLNNPHNYVHLLAGTDSTAAYGQTSDASDFTFVFVQGINNSCGADLTCRANLNMSTTSHECMHHVQVNPNAPCVLGHDGGSGQFNIAWCGDSGNTCASPLGVTRCLMSGATDAGQNAQDRDEYNKMECEDLGVEGNPLPCIWTDCGDGVRTQTDPQ